MKIYPTLTNLKPEFRHSKENNEYLANLGAPHLGSFNYMLQNGLKNVTKYLTPIHIKLPSGQNLQYSVQDIHIAQPSVPVDVINVKDRKIYPSECRQRKITYAGKCTLQISWSVNGIEKSSINIEAGDVPIMIKSSACNLSGLSPTKLIEKGEHENEWGGYFIVKGHEKIIRMLLMSRRNYPIAVRRNTWKDRGKLFTDLGILIRTVRDDETSFNNVLHFLSNGTAKLMFSQMKFLSYVPVCLILKMLTNSTDEVIYEKLIKGFENDQYYLSCIKNMLREVHDEGLHTQDECKFYFGKLFRQRFSELPEWSTDIDVANYILNDRILIHLNSHEDKFNLLIFMVQKLFQCAQDQCKIENVDGVMMQEVLLGGHLYQKVLSERISAWLLIAKLIILKKHSEPDNLITSNSILQCFKQVGSSLSKSLETFLATGNLASRSGLGLMQNSGLVVMAENINRMRYMSHFRAVHRGSYFTTMRTTEARQLLPDAWGFICPVHTPDGTPCGLLNHLTVSCYISNEVDLNQINEIPKILVNLGMISINSPVFDSEAKTCIVMLEGKILGYIRQHDAHKIVEKLRWFKIHDTIPKMTEIVYIPSTKKGQYPGLFLFIGPARMMRPVKNLLHNGKIEYIGSFEQVYMDIAIDEKEIYPGITTHLELSKTEFLSNLANLIPMPDYNQSPRNMYQCQMGKQTMGTPCHNFQLQAETKLYRLQTPATPLFRPIHYDNLNLDDFAMGTNAIVAVISYTGYDMEDAMIINKSAHERGFAYGSIQKSHFIELKGSSYFARDPHNHELNKFLDNDGLPYPGMKLSYKNVLYCYFDTDDSVYKVVKNEEKEDAVIDSVKYCGSFKLNSPRTVCITIRVPRKPTIGDKFASRAGQKGICSQKYPAEDLPFTETGLIPDIVFNPHGFPSRMTIAMMIETMAGKSAAIHGLVHDATPFRFNEKKTAIDYFGTLLEKAGYNYYGTERMYSGVDGREMQADIFFGIVHYQRLRHMVFDKWQVRSTGPVDAITQQPIKGRKKGGGVRFGEMERDGLISHGASFLLQDRLFHNSDRTSVLICNKCGNLLSTIDKVLKRNQDIDNETGVSGAFIKTPAHCRMCNDSDVSHIEVPFSFKYLATELSSVNINAHFKFEII